MKVQRLVTLMQQQVRRVVSSKRSFLFLVLALLLPIDGALGETRGIRNHNPANLILTSIKWQGEVRCSDVRFECFATPYHGLRAMYKTLRTYYYRYDRVTLHSIIHHWSPAHENRTNHLISILSNKLEYDPDTPIPIRDIDFMVRMGSAMVTIENGKNPYKAQTYRRAIKDAFRDNNNARFYASSGGNVPMVNESKSKGSTTEGSHRKRNSTEGSSSRGTSREGQNLCIYKTSNSNSYNIRSNCISFNSSTHVGSNCNTRLDGVAKWLPLLYGRSRCGSLERGQGPSNYSPPHSPSRSNQWAILRREYRRQIERVYIM